MRLSFRLAYQDKQSAHEEATKCGAGAAVVTLNDAKDKFIVEHLAADRLAASPENGDGL